MRAVVVTVGDLGRSARMQYHAQALAARGVEVDLVGLEGTAVPRAVAGDSRIAVHRFAVPETRSATRRSLAYLVAAARDSLRMAVRLRRVLRSLPPPDLVLVQNRSAFPVVVVTYLIVRRRGVRFVIDWHNLGHTLVALRLGRDHPVVRIVRWLERRGAQCADAHLCVSRGLGEYLRDRFAVDGAHVLYDRPAAVYATSDHADRERFRQALFGRLGIHANTVGFVVCPTSWTEDEDFDVVIEAVVRLEERIRGWEAGSSRRFPHLAVLVTGDGSRRAGFERRFAGLHARRIQLRTRWLDPEDYPRVVGIADLGLCLHRSSSGLDIPMKVADLFGAGVPVCVLDYGACLAERVRHGENGLLFSTARQLADLLFELFETFPSDQTLLNRLRAGARRSARPTWEEGWAREALPVLVPAGISP